MRVNIVIGLSVVALASAAIISPVSVPITDGLWQPENVTPFFSSAYVEVSQLVWGRVWTCPVAIGVGVITFTHVGEPGVEVGIGDVTHIMGEAEAFVARESVVACASLPASSPSPWGVSWTPLGGSLTVESGVTTIDANVTCCVGTAPGVALVVPDTNPEATLAIRPGGVSLCAQTDDVVLQCTPLDGDPDWRHTDPRDTIEVFPGVVHTRCATPVPGTGVSGHGGLRQCECVFSEEAGDAHFSNCSLCVASETVAPVLPFAPRAVRSIADPLSCVDALQDQWTACSSEWSLDGLRFDLPWLNADTGEWESSDERRTGRLPSARCVCADANRDATPVAPADDDGVTGRCRHCVQGWYEGDVASLAPLAWRCLPCADAMDADPGAPNCAWRTGALRPDSPEQTGSDGDCKQSPTSAGADGGFLPSAATCVCRQGYTGATCSECTSGFARLTPANASLLTGGRDVCVPCPAHTCGPFGVNVCSGEAVASDAAAIGDVYDPGYGFTASSMTCVCAPGFSSSTNATACSTCGHEVCGPGGVCDPHLIEDTHGASACVCNVPGWSLAPGDHFQTCSVCDPSTAFFDVIDDTCVHVPTLCSGGVDVAASVVAKACVCTPGFLTLPGDVTHCVSGAVACTASGDPQGVNASATTATNACVCQGQFVLAPPHDVCTHITEICGNGAVSHGAVAPCVCDPSWAPIDLQPSGRCDVCVDDDHTGPLCTTCTETCPGRSVCIPSEAHGFSCVCVSGWVDGPLGECSRCDNTTHVEWGEWCVPCPPDCGPHGVCAPTSPATAVCVCDADEWLHLRATDPTSPCTRCKHTNTQTSDCVPCSPLCASTGTCNPGGVCECHGNFASPPECLDCTPGFVGPDCDSCVVECGHHGTCSWSSALLHQVCVCDPGWEGDVCDVCASGVHTEDGECLACPPCTATQTCVASPTHGARCVCAPGWFGEDCSICDPLDGCALCPCWAETVPDDAGVRGVVCTWEGASPTCVCAPGWTHVDGDTSGCRPCDPLSETPHLCLTCPRCDAVSETCVESPDRIAICACRAGWTTVPGFETAGCFSTAFIDGLLSILTNTLVADADALFKTTVDDDSGSDTVFTPQIITSVVVLALVAFVLGGGVTVFVTRRLSATKSHTQ